MTIANTSQFNENRRISGSQQVLQHIESVYVLKCKEKCENYVDRTVVLSTRGPFQQCLLDQLFWFCHFLTSSPTLYNRPALH